MVFACQRRVAAQEVEGFTAPYRVLRIAAPEPGNLDELLVAEGDRVREGDVIARLDNEVHFALLAIAKASMELEGKLKASRAELAMRDRRLKKFKELEPKGHVRPEEIDRAAADVEIAKGNVMTAQEELLLNRLEYEKIKAQINRRHIRAPITGVVSTILKQQGEFAAANDSDVLILVQLNPLIAQFNIERSLVSGLRVGEHVQVVFEQTGQKARGAVEFVSPLTDAESGTVDVKIRIPNENNLYRSGERCLLKLAN
jgi:RND family efflux transporter MFP subunit